MIRSIIVLVGAVAVARAAMMEMPMMRSALMEIPIIKSSSEVRPDGFAYEYETGNGIKAEARGSMKDPETQAVQGSFSFVADDGQTYSVQYTADENGFQPQGAHLPTPPPIPEAIQRSLEWNAAHPDPNQKDA